MGMEERHRPGSLKQQNKQHKHGRHKSKGAMALAQKGKVSVKTITNKMKSLQSKGDRRNQIMQNRLKKRDEVLAKKRQLGSGSAPPFLICVVPLSQDVRVGKLLNYLTRCDSQSSTSTSPEGVLHLNVPRWKQRFSFVCPEKGNLIAVLDTLKIADTVLYLTSASSNPFIDDVTKNMLTATIAQGIPSTIAVVMDLEAVPLKKRNLCKQEVQKALSQWLREDKVMALDKDIDALNVLRKIGNQKQRPVMQRDNRPHLLAEDLDWCPEDSGTGTLKVSGYLHSQVLFVNSLLHIPGWGDYQMKQIDLPPDPYSFDKDEANIPVRVLAVADPDKQTKLECENIPDAMDAEQTWPTQEELAEAKTRQKIVKKIPKGMSDYQACWIPDEASSELDEYDDAEDVDKDMEVQSEEDSGEEASSEEEFDTVTTAEGEVEADKYDEKMDMKEEECAKTRLKDAKQDQAYPDEVDTPMDIAARDRFQKYRGLSSFRTSPWDPKENLPQDYARIFQFENFNRTRKRIYSELAKEIGQGAVPGLYVTIHVAGVSRDKWEEHRATVPVVVYGLLEHEHRMSVVNMVVKRCPASTLAQEPIQAKESLVFQCGYRRYTGCPIFSQHTNGNKHKYERFFQPNATAVATLFAPIVYPPATVLVFKRCLNTSDLELVATGSVLSVNPDRLVIKRVVLSGHPFKVHKKSAVVRFMFFNREDIDWFKPVELRTKYGRRGHIKEPLGTHGHMKTVFDGQLKSQDTVLMHLYKRVFPKWTFQPFSVSTATLYKDLPVIMEEDDAPI